MRKRRVRRKARQGGGWMLGRQKRREPYIGKGREKRRKDAGKESAKHTGD